MNKTKMLDLPEKPNFPMYTANEMWKYAEDTLAEYVDENYGTDRSTIQVLKADIKVKDITIRTLQTEILKLRNREPIVESYDLQEVRRLRERVKQLEKQVSDYGWLVNPDRMGQ
jgi:hypothetical protein